MRDHRWSSCTADQAPATTTSAPASIASPSAARWSTTTSGAAASRRFRRGRRSGWQEQVADLEALRETWGLERLTICGYSWGGLLAMLYATEHPDRVARLALVSPAPAWRAARARVRGDVLGPQHEPRPAGRARGTARQRAPRTRSGGVPAPSLRALSGALLRRSCAGAAADVIPGHRAHAAGGVVEPGRLRPPASGSRSWTCRRWCCTGRRT